MKKLLIIFTLFINLTQAGEYFFKEGDTILLSYGFSEKDTTSYDEIHPSNQFEDNYVAQNDDLEDILENSQKADLDPTKWAFIISIENYKDADEVRFSKRSGEMFYSFVGSP